MRLLYMLDVESFPATRRKWPRCPLSATDGKCGLVHIQLDDSLAYIQSDHVPRVHQSQRATCCRFWGSVQNDGAISGAAHAAVGDTDHASHALAQKLAWQA